MEQGTIGQGRYGSGYFAQADGGFMEIPTSPEFDFVDGYTIEFWVRIDSEQTSAYVFFRGDDGNPETYQHLIVVGSNNVLHCHNNTSWNAGLDVGVSTWHHVAVTWDGAVQRTFIDAQPQAFYNCAGEMPETNANIWIGKGPTTAQNTLLGAMDNVALFDHPRGNETICADGGGSWNGGLCDYPE